MNWYTAYEKSIAAASDVVIAFDPWSACTTCGTWVKYSAPCDCPRVVKDAQHRCYCCGEVAPTINHACGPCRVLYLGVTA